MALSHIMGRVYSPGELAAGHYPESTQVHVETATALMRQAIDMSQDRPPGEAVEALVYGSVALGLHSRRSDLDAILVTPDASEIADGLTLARSIARLQAAGHVAIEPIIISQTALRVGDHPSISDLLFREHLQTVVHGSPYKVGDPTRYLRGQDRYALTADEQFRTVHQTTTRYVEHKKHGALTALADGDVSITKALQRSFELPSSLSRIMVRVKQLDQLRKHGGWNMNELPPTAAVGRQDLEAMVYAVAPPDSAWGEHASWLIAQNRQYTEALESTIGGETTIEIYDAWLQRITPDVLERTYQLGVAASTLLLRSAANIETPSVHS